MNKSKVTLALLSMVSLVTLASCSDPLVKSSEGYVLTLEAPSGSTINYTADELFSQYKGNATGVAKFYEAVTEVIIRNEMNLPENAAKLSEITEKAVNRVDGVKETAKSTADTNGTNYDAELEALFTTYNVADLVELKDYFSYQLMKEEVEKVFYDENKQELLLGATDYAGYLDTKLPYHVRHILVKVSDTSSSIYDGAIAAQEARNLASVIYRLALRQNDETFGEIAREASEDTGSAANFGDLGIMSKSTGYVNEFKLGVYAYDAIYNQTAGVVANAEKLALPADAATFLDGLGLGSIPYEASLKLQEYADIIKDENGDSVNNGDSKYFPRNVYFNKFFNKHNVSVITPTLTDGSIDAGYSALAGFQAVAELGGQKVLTDEAGRVILAVRAGTGSGQSGYQGIHFIVVQRSALVDTSSTGVTLEDYYTTEIPGTSTFPKVGDVELTTYVNYMKTTTKIYKERSETITNEVKTFDKMLQARIFEKYLESQSLTFVDTELGAAIINYIAVTRENNAFTDNLSYEDNWGTYIRFLQYQEWQRERLVDETCAVNFQNDTAGVYNEGGLCYVQK